MPVVNGSTAGAAIKGAILLLVVLVAAVTAIVISGKDIPEIFASGFTLLIGFIIGSRVITDDVKESVARKDGGNAQA